MRVWQQRAPKHQARSEVAKATDSRTDSRARVLDGGQVPHWKPFLFHDRNQGVEHVPLVRCDIFGKIWVLAETGGSPLRVEKQKALLPVCTEMV